MLPHPPLDGPAKEVSIADLLITALTVLIVVDALGWALGVLPVLRYAFHHGELPTVVGIKALSGPFEALGLTPDSEPEAGRPCPRPTLLAISAISWHGFAPPFGTLPGPAQVVLMALAWKNSPSGYGKPLPALPRSGHCAAARQRRSP